MSAKSASVTLQVGFSEADLWDLNLAAAVIESNATGLLPMIRLLYFLRWMGQLKLPP
jgi:hypothetical protein